MGDSDSLQWQKDARTAFTWIANMYEQAQSLWDDAWRYFVEDDWMPQCSNGLGGIAMSQSDLSTWPFIYLKAMVALPKDFRGEQNGTLPILGLLFHDLVRIGPTCFAGTVKWKGEPKADHWVLFEALTLYKGRYQSTVDACFHLARPTPETLKKKPSVEEIRWFELPLGAITTAKLLKSIVHAASEMADGHDAEARTLASGFAR